MRITDPVTRRTYIQKRRVRCNEAGEPRELTFSCYHQYAFGVRPVKLETDDDVLVELARG